MNRLWWIMAFAALLLGVRASQYVTLDPRLFEPALRVHYRSYIPVVAVHASSSIGALVLGPLLLHSWLRTRFLVAHKILGWIYLSCVAVGGMSGIYMATRAYGGFVSQAGLTMLALGWLLTATLGLRAIRRKEIGAHRRWMSRNYALTFAALTLRLDLAALLFAGIANPYAYRIAAWSSWMVNLLVCERLLVGRRALRKG